MSLSPIITSEFERPILPCELLEHIFSYSSALSEGHIVCRLDSICRGIMSSLMQKNAHQILKNSRTEDTSLYQFIKNELGSRELTTDEDYSFLFRDLVQKAKSLGGVCSNRMLDPLEVHALSALIEDRALEGIWPKLCDEISKANPDQELDLNLKSRKIRKWLKKNPTLLQKVTSLNLSSSGLKALPAEIGLFTSLDILDISHNQLTSLPSKIGKLKSLSFFNLSDNQLMSFPIEIGKFVKLRRLDVQNNRLEALPIEIIEKLTLLRFLNLSANRLTVYPEKLGALGIWKVDLSHNQLRDLPFELKYGPCLRDGINLEGNPGLSSGC